MSQFLLLLHERPADFADVSPDEVQSILRAYIEWRETLVQEGRIIGSNKLQDEGGKHLARDGGTYRTTDGPYAEAKEVIAGYFLIEADDYAHAIETARSCPHLNHGRIEIRQVDQTST